MPDPACPRSVLALTVNIHGSSVELRDADAGALYGKLSYGGYGRNIGNARLLDLFHRLGLKATFFVPAYEAENDPRLVEAILAGGHEIAAHGHAMEDHAVLGDREAELLSLAHDTLVRLIGAAPAGWRAPEGKLSATTLGYLAKLGYSYDSSFQDDDFPYSLAADGGGSMLELPQNQILIDATFYRARQTHDRVAKHWREELEAAVEEGCFLCLTLHGRADYGSGRASRIAVAEAFLKHVLELGVPVRRCIDVIEDLARGSA
jgi:peptidoglycan/xylan/chitin deacetylase (PgdA/CDA1 family)